MQIDHEYSIDDLIRCASRELTMREKVYASRVRDGRMAEAEADHEINCQLDILSILKQIKKAREPQRELFA